VVNLLRSAWGKLKAKMGCKTRVKPLEPPPTAAPAPPGCWSKLKDKLGVKPKQPKSEAPSAETPDEPEEDGGDMAPPPNHLYSRSPSGSVFVPPHPFDFQHG